MRGGASLSHDIRVVDHPADDGGERGHALMLVLHRGAHGCGAQHHRVVMSGGEGDGFIVEVAQVVHRGVDLGGELEAALVGPVVHVGLCNGGGG